MSNDWWDYLEHSQGPWKKHKYIRKDGRKYVYDSEGHGHEVVPSNNDSSHIRSVRDVKRGFKNKRKELIKKANKAMEKLDPYEMMEYYNNNVKPESSYYDDKMKHLNHIVKQDRRDRRLKQLKKKRDEQFKKMIDNKDISIGKLYDIAKDSIGILSKQHDLNKYKKRVRKESDEVDQKRKGLRK